VPFRIDASSALGARRDANTGGLIAPANLTRTGVLTYYTPDGKARRELRHPDQVFAADSLATLRSIPVTVGHPAEVTPANWKAVAVGHVDTEGKQEGKFVAADVRVMDGNAIHAIENKTLQEVSCGYMCKLDMTPGTFEGEDYDGLQTDIRYNHLALLPKGGGRAGAEVRLRLDSNDDVTLLLPDPLLPSSREDSEMTPEQIKALQDALAAAEKRADATEKLSGQVEFLTKESADLKAKLAEATDAKRLDSAVDSRVALVTEARLVLDSKDAQYVAAGKSDHQVRSDVLARLQPSFKLDGRSEAAVQGAYELAISGHAAAKSSVAAVQGIRADAKPAVDTIGAARIANVKASEDAWKTYTPACSGKK
jgi:uncharacterized protein